MKLLLIDDDPRVRRLIKRTLKEDYVVETASSAQDGEDLAYGSHFDIILLDLVLPDMDGEDLCALLKAQIPDVPIIALSSKQGMTDKDYAIRKGADDYMVKPINIAELKLKIKALLRRFKETKFLGAEELKVRGLKLNRLRKTVTCKNKRILLRRKEIELLEFLMLNKGKVLTRGEILEHVWESSTNPFTNTVDVHIKRLRDKLEKPYKKKFIETIHGMGYIFE